MQRVRMNPNLDVFSMVFDETCIIIYV
jgi:hypothetical protein